MKPYNRDSYCPKCGRNPWAWPSIDAKYVAAAVQESGGTVNEYDYIERTCPNCGYTWKEACLDAAADDAHD